MVFCLTIVSNAFAFLEPDPENIIANRASRPIFKDAKSERARLYLGIGGGAVYTRMYDVNNLGLKKTMTDYNQRSGFNMSSGSGVSFTLGLRGRDSSFRHEIEYSRISGIKSLLDGDKNGQINIVNDTDYTENQYDNVSLSLMQERIMYNLYYQTRRKAEGNVGFFFGGGLGFAGTRGTLSAGDGGEGDEAAATMFTTNKILSLAYEVAMGTTFDISNYASVQVKVKYAIINKPQWAFDGRNINSMSEPGIMGNSRHLMHMFGVDFSAFFKVL